MKRSRLSWFLLGVSMIFLVGAVGIRNDGIEFPDGSVQTSASQSKSFYVTDSFWDGASALSACSAGYHMASIWEIFDVTHIRYASEATGAVQPQDGVPVTFYYAWVRTGHVSGIDPNPGLSNCGLWTLNDNGSHGGTATLQWLWSNPNSAISPWHVQVETCDSTFPVWCVSD